MEIVRKKFTTYSIKEPLIGYIMSRFPKITETFILREMLELEKSGQPLLILPLIRLKEPVFHAEVKQLMSRVIFTPFISVKIISANLHFMTRSPRKYLKILWTVLRENFGSANLFKGALGIFPKSVFFARSIEEKGIRHVHAHYSTHPALSALIISELTGISFSFTAHAHDIFVHKKMLGYKINRAKFVVTISEFNKQYILKFFPETPMEKIKVIHCGVNLEKYKSLNLSKVQRISFPLQNKRGSIFKNQFSILCVASLQPYKGLDYLIKACALLKKLIQFRCQIVGEGKERKKIEKLIKKLNLNEEVKLLGSQTEEMVADLLRETDLFVCPSIVARDGQMEGIPVAVMEAMASGLPVVATNISGIPELVEDGVTGLLVPPGDEHTLADAIIRLYNDETLRGKMGTRGKEKVASEFEIKANVEKLKNLFNTAIVQKTEGEDFEIGIRKCILESLSKHFPYNTCYKDITDISLHNTSGGHDSKVYEVILKNNSHTLPKFILKLHLRRPKENADSIEFSRDNSYREYNSLLLLWKEFSFLTNRFKIPRPFDHFPEFAAILMEKCDGIRFDQSLRWTKLFGTKHRYTSIYQNAKACGEWLAMFHLITKRDEEPYPIYERIESEFYNDLKNCIRFGLKGELADRVRSIFEKKRDLAFHGKHKIVGHHCDFGPYNVFISTNAVTVVDFEGMMDGIIYDDICYFLCMIGTIPSYHLNSKLRMRIKECFLEGYSNYEEIDQHEFGLYMLISMVKIMSRNPVFRENNKTLRDRFRRYLIFNLFSNWFEEQLVDQKVI